MTEDIKTLAKSQLFSLKGETVALHADAGPYNLKGRPSRHAAGAVIDQKYKIISLLGEGGMGAVYKAHHILLNKEVALKTFRSPHLSDVALQRFQREAQAIARLTHPNIVQVFDFGIGEDNIPYYTMECLVGESLADSVEALDHLSVEKAARIFIQVSQGLALSHSKGIIHRDLKPGNIFLEQGSKAGNRSELVKIVDFGLAGWATDSMEGQKLTAAGTVFGSPLYMSPEQSLGYEVTERSDIYSCGCALFHTLTGNPPFHGENALATMLLHQSKPAPVLTSQKGEPEFSQRLVALVNRMLAKDQEKRIQTFNAVALELEEVQKASMVRRASRGHSAAGTMTVAGQEPLNRRLPWRLGATVSLIFAGLIGLGALSVAVAPQWQRKSKVASTPVQTSPVPPTPAPAAQSKLPTWKKRLYNQNPNAGASQWRTFLFPPDTSLGNLQWGFSPGYDRGKKAPDSNPAKGEKSVPPFAVLRLTAGQALTDNPELLNGFGPNDLAEFTYDYKSASSWEDRHMKCVGRLSGLSVLNIDNAIVGNRSFDDINKLLNLHQLHVRFTHLTGDTIANLAVLRRLDSLCASRISNIRPALKKLGGSRALHYLQLDQCDLTDNNLEIIATMPEITHLLLSKNKQITDRGLDAISKLSGVSELWLDGTRISPDGIGALKRMKSLKLLYVDPDQLTPAGRVKLRQAMPNCTIKEVDVAKAKENRGVAQFLAWSPNQNINWACTTTKT